MEPTQEYGWRMLQEGEKRMAGDQFWGGLGWSDIETSIGMTKNHFRHTACRRRIYPGEGWEIIPANECVCRNQESIGDDNVWIHHSWPRSSKMPTAAEAMRECNEDKPCAMVLAFRRRKQPESEWLDIKTVRPKIGDQIWWVHPTMGVMLSNYSAGGWQQLATHWRPVKHGEIPKAPELKKSQKEIDAEASQEWYRNQSDKADELAEQALRKAFEDGLRIGRASK